MSSSLNNTEKNRFWKEPDQSRERWRGILSSIFGDFRWREHVAFFRFLSKIIYLFFGEENSRTYPGRFRFNFILILPGQFLLASETDFDKFIKNVWRTK